MRWARARSRSSRERRGQACSQDSQAARPSGRLSIAPSTKYWSYSNTQSSDPDQDDDDSAQEALAARVASLGEPFKIHFETDALHANLTALGFVRIEDLGPLLICQRYFDNRGGSLSDRGGHLVRATTV